MRNNQSQGEDCASGSIDNMRSSAVSLFLMLACIGKLVGNTSEELIGIETGTLVALILKPNIVFDISFLLSTTDDAYYDTPLDRRSDILPDLALDPSTTLHPSFAPK